MKDEEDGRRCREGGGFTRIRAEREGQSRLRLPPHAGVGAAAPSKRRVAERGGKLGEQEEGGSGVMAVAWGRFRVRNKKIIDRSQASKGLAT